MHQHQVVDSGNDFLRMIHTRNVRTKIKFYVKQAGCIFSLIYLNDRKCIQKSPLILGCILQAKQNRCKKHE